MTYKAPKSIINHLGVSECLDAEAEGAEGYRHDIFLKEGWAFGIGRNAGGRNLFCNTVAEFLACKPQFLGNT
jgi:hypothetical protein